MPTVRKSATSVPGWPRSANAMVQSETGTVVHGSACGLTRRAAVRLLAACTFAAPAALRSEPSRAIKGWCRRDPIVKIGGVTAHVVLTSYAGIEELATGASRLVITVPVGVPTRYVARDPGFGHLGYDVRFEESASLLAHPESIDVRIEAYTPTATPLDAPLPLVVAFTARGGGRPVSHQIEGWANEWVLLHASLPVRDFAPPPTAPDASDDIPDATPRDRPGEDTGGVAGPAAQKGKGKGKGKGKAKRKRRKGRRK